MMPYRPRRQGKRWLDADCPPGVLAIYDSKGAGERYTVFYAEPVYGSALSDMWLGYRGMSCAPFDPQGVGLYGEMKAYEVSLYRHKFRHHATKWSRLPDDVKRCVRQDLETSV